MRAELADVKRYLKLPAFCAGASITVFEDAEVKLINQKLRIMIEKRQMRGTANIQRQGLLGVVNRLSEDKLERVKRMVEDDFLVRKLEERGVSGFTGLKALTDTEQKLQLEDDLMDISNYCDIAILMLRNSWE